MNLVETQSWDSGFVTLTNNHRERDFTTFTFQSPVKGIASIQATNKVYESGENLRMFVAVPTYPNPPIDPSGTGMRPTSTDPPVVIDGNVVSVRTLKWAGSSGGGAIRLQIHLAVFI